MALGNLNLPGNGHISFVSTLRILELGKCIGHYPPLPDALRTGNPLGAGGPLGFDVFPAVLLASGWAAACLFASADFTASFKLWGRFSSLIQLFTSVCQYSKKYSKDQAFLVAQAVVLNQWV